MALKFVKNNKIMKYKDHPKNFDMMLPCTKVYSKSSGLLNISEMRVFKNVGSISWSTSPKKFV